MSCDWPEYILGDLCDFQNGFAFKNSDYINCSADTWEVFRMGYISRGGGFKEDTTPVFVSKNYAKKLDRYLLRKGDLTIAMTDMKNSMALLGHTARIPADQRFVLNQRVGCIRVRETQTLDPIFLYYYSNSPEFIAYLRTRANSGVQVNLSTTSIKDSIIKVPPLNVQKSIAEVLGRLDDKITINQQTNQTLEEIAQAIFKSWFVDFEPVKAKVAALEAGGTEEDAIMAAMQAISGKDKAQLARFKAEQPDQYNELRTTAELFPSGMQDSELGEIPEGWTLSQIGDEAIVVGGGTPSTKNPEYWENGHIHWSSPKDMSNLRDKVLTDTERKITPAGLAKISSGLLPTDTVLMSSRAPVGYLALTKVPTAINQGYIALKCEKALSPEFVLQWCSANMDEIKSRASGTTFAEISKKNFKIIPVVVPSEGAIREYSKHARRIYLQIENNAKTTQSLTNIRDTLLPKLLSGYLSVASTEAES